MKTRQVVSIEKIKPDPHQPRKTFIQADIESLAHNIKTEGIINLIEVDPSFTIIVGERRFKALQRLGLKEIEVVVNDDPLTPYERLRRQMSENLHQSASKNGEAMPSLETAQGWAKLYELKTGKAYSPGKYALHHKKGVPGSLPGPLAIIVDEVGANKTTAWEVLQILGEPQYVQDALKPNKVFKKGMPRTLIREANRAPKELQEEIKRKMVAGEYSSRDELAQDVALARKYPNIIPSIILRRRAEEPPEINRIMRGGVRLILALEALPLDKVGGKQKNIVRNHLFWVQEELEKYLIEDITPVN